MKNKLWFYILFFLFLSGKTTGQDLTAVLGAMPEEVQAYKQILEQPAEMIIQGLSFTSGYINKRPVVIAVSGIGKVNAAMTCTLLLDHFKPSRVLFTGVAGGLASDIHIGDIIIADSLIQYDFGTLNDDKKITYWGVTNPIDNSSNPIFYKPDAALLSIAREQTSKLVLAPLRIGQADFNPKIRNGIIATGDLFISSADKKHELSSSLKADAVEMEGAAVAQVCYQQKVPFLVIRSISDLAGKEAQISFDQFLKTAAENAVRLVKQIVEALPEYEGKPSATFIKTELYFGLMQNGRMIREKQWKKFLAEQITPSFPEGLTVINSYGQWQSEKDGKTIKEKSRLVIIIHNQDALTDHHISQIIRNYCAQFRQESVLRIDIQTNKVIF